MDSNKKVVITYGTFDMFHIGHLKLVQRMRSYGDKVIVAVSTDKFNLLKGKKCLIPYEQRAEIIKNIVGVDQVIKEESWEQKVSDIKKYSVDSLIMGDDWVGKFDFLTDYCNVVYLPRTMGISTTEIKNTLSAVEFNAVNNIINILKTIKKELG